MQHLIVRNSGHIPTSLLVCHSVKELKKHFELLKEAEAFESPVMRSNGESIVPRPSSSNMTCSSALLYPSRTRPLATAGVGGDPAVTPRQPHDVHRNMPNSSVQEAREVRYLRLVVWATSLTNVPQIVAATIILASYWQSETLCYWNQGWALLQTIHLTLTLLLEWTIHYINLGRSNLAISLREQYMTRLSRISYGFSMIGDLWCIAGYMYIIHGGQCNDGSTMRVLTFWMVIISYVNYLMAVWLICLFVQVIDQSKTMTYTVNTFPPEDACCCICLNDYEDSQSLRVLPCAHQFRTECVDEWLLVNWTCPTCRKLIADAQAVPQQA